MLAKDKRLHERSRPAIRPVVNGDVLLPWIQVFKRAVGDSLGQPVRHKQCKIEPAVAQTAVLDALIVEFVNPDRELPRLWCRDAMTRTTALALPAHSQSLNSFGSRFAGLSFALWPGLEISMKIAHAKVMAGGSIPFHGQPQYNRAALE